MQAAFKKIISPVTRTAHIIVRKSEERGGADHGWLKTKHTFSFAGYYDPNFENWGSLRVINEDLVQPGQGFGKHPHREFEIFSYIVSGELTHRDSMKNIEVLKRGGVQFTSAGTGISHSEFNENKKDWVHFLQIWVKPSEEGLTPSYTTKYFTDEQKKGKLCKIISPDGSENSIVIHQDLTMYASILEKDVEVKHHFEKGRKGYIHVTKTGGNVLLNGDIELKEGDGAFLTDLDDLTIKGTTDKAAEFVLFDLSSTEPDFL